MPFLGGRGQASRGYFGGGTTPGAPTGLVATKGNGQVSVAFTAPVFDGGLPITTYQFALSTDGFTTFTTRSTGTTASPLVITGLTNGTSIEVKLRAVNSLGAGSASVASTAVIPSTVPGTPTNVQGTANGVTASTVTWTAPAPANTGPNFTDITGYKVEYALSPYSSYTVFTADTGNANTSISVTGLNNGGSYKFKVTARNVPNDFGTTSAESAVVVTNIVPGAPTIGTMTLSTSNTTDSLAWTAPASNGGSAITGYVYQTTTNNGGSFAASEPTGSTATSKTFNPGFTSTTTKVRVAAVNSLNEPGPFSAISAVGFGGWASEGAVVHHETACPLPSCFCDAPICASCGSCPACDACECGYQNSSGNAGTNVPTAGESTHSGQTNTRTCYRWTRGAQASGYNFNQNSTAECSAVFSGCTGGSCSACTAGSCSGCTSTCTCSGCDNTGTNNLKTGNFSQGGLGYSYSGTPGEYVIYPHPFCSNGCDYSVAYFTVTTCSTTGTNTIVYQNFDVCRNIDSNPC